MSPDEAFHILREDLRASRAEQRADLAQFREEVSSKFTALEARVDAVHTTHTHGKGWIAGALAVVSLIIAVAGWAMRLAPLALATVLAGCAAAPGGPFVSARWHENDRPVPVYLDPAMPDECKLASMYALDTWRVRGIGYLVAREGAPGPLQRGYIVVRYNPNLIRRRGWDGVTYGQKEAGRMISAVIELDACRESIADHEIGHGLGLEHYPEDEAYREFLMWPEPGRGTHVGPIELGIIR